MSEAKPRKHKNEEKEPWEAGSFCGNMFESFHSSEEEWDGKSDELWESSINLDITTGKAELYEGQSNQKENWEYENDEYLMFKPAYEKTVW